MKLLEKFETKEMFKKYCEVVVEGEENCTGYWKQYWKDEKDNLKEMIAERIKAEEGYEIAIAIYNIVNGDDVKIKETEEDLDYDLEDLHPTEIIRDYGDLDLDCDYYMYKDKYGKEIEMLTQFDLDRLFDYDELANLAIDNISGNVNNCSEDINNILKALFN